MHDTLHEHLEVLKGQDKAQGTIQRYTGALKAYSEWLEEEDTEPEEVGSLDLQRYLSWLKNERGYAPKTIRGYFSSVSGLYRNLKMAGEIEDDPTEDIRVSNYASRETLQEQETKEERVWLTKEEIHSLVENVPEPTIRNRLLVLFQYFTGLRRQEVVDVRLDDLDRENRLVRVRGKGNKLHTAHWQPKLDGLLTQWLDKGYRASSPYADESPYLFVSESAPSVSGDRLNKIVVQAAKNAGIQEVAYEDAMGRNRYKYTSHNLRHSFAVHWLENGGSIEALSKHMAHSSVTTTEIYGEILDKRADDEYKKFAPDVEMSF